MPLFRHVTMALWLWCIAALVIPPPAFAEPPLRVCLQANDPPLSSRDSGAGFGFDVQLVRLIAGRIGRPLEIQWFTTRDDHDSNPVTEADALLSDGHCELVAGYPLMADKLGQPSAPTGKLPPFAGARPEDRRRWITLGELVATRPYRFDAITVALSPEHAGQPVRSLEDLRALGVGVVIHGLPDLIAMSYRQGQLADKVHHFDRSSELFAQLENNKIDAALIDARELDAWRLAHPGTRVAATSYRHPIGFNIGFVGLAGAGALIERVNVILAGLVADGSLIAIARDSGLTYDPPRTPDVSTGVTLSALAHD